MADDQGGGSGSAPAGERERRRSTRFPVEMWVEEITDGHQVFRRAGNVSRGGLYLDQTIPLPIGSTVSLRFTLPGDDKSIAVSGKIVSIKKDQALGMGVMFTTIDTDAQLRIDTYLERLAEVTTSGAG